MGLLPPQLGLVLLIGEYLSRLAALALFIFFSLILYDLARTLYRASRDLYKETVEKIANWLHAGSR